MRNNIKERIMTRKFISAIVAVAAVMTVQAQGVCTIKGELPASLLADGNNVKKVYLSRVEECGFSVVVDSAKVKKGAYSFKYKMAADAPVMCYFVSCEGNQPLQEFFVEPGKVNVSAESCTATGTPTNDWYTAYCALGRAADAAREQVIDSLKKSRGEAWIKSSAGANVVVTETAKLAIKSSGDKLKYILDNSLSPAAPYVMQRDIMPVLTNTYADQLVKAVPLALHTHPYYTALRNAVLTRDLKVGNEYPDIALPLRDGTTARLSNYRGKYVLLHFWAGWSDVCTQKLPTLKALYDATKENREKFLIVSFSLDNKDAVWKNAIKNNDLDREGWIHGSELAGWQSVASRGIKGIPEMVLLDPEGRAISFTLKGEELIERVLQIMSGDLYYLDQEK